MNHKKRVVITGMGIISPIGCDLDAYWRHLASGTSGVALLDAFDTSDFEVKIAAEIKDFELVDLVDIDAKEARRLDRFTQFALAASCQAVHNSALDIDQEDRRKIGVLIGSGIGGIATIVEQHHRLLDRGPGRVSPFLIPRLMVNAPSGHVAIHFGIQGPNLAVVTACATAANSIGIAMQFIQTGIADVMIAGGSEAALVSLGMSGFQTMKALSTRNHEPEKASRPFDRERDGFVMGEGAGVVVLESLDHAQKRHAPICCELSGFGFSGDACHITAPEPEGRGAQQAMEAAVTSAGIHVDQVDYINAHGTSTPLGDIAETKAIKAVFGKHAHTLSVSSTKSMIGHLLGASGGAELIATILCMNKQTIHPTINLDNPDPACDLDYVPHTAKQKAIQHALCNSFGFGGHNASLLVSRHPE